MRSLFDSIWRGFPVGTLLLWRRPGEGGQVSLGPLRVEGDKSVEAFWVVDGQQRVTTLVGALSSLVEEGSDATFEICFDLRRGRFVHATKRPRPSWWLPLRVTLESRRLLGWIRNFGDELSTDELDLADQLAGTLRDYKIPAYVVENDDEQVLRDVFDRVNSAGKPISRAQVFHALFGGGAEAGSASAVVESVEASGFGKLDEQRVIQSLLAIRGGNVARDLHEEFVVGEDPAEWFDATEVALSRSIEFLNRVGVQHLLLMPQTLPLPVLASFFHLHPEPDYWSQRLLARWVWRGWTHGFGRSGQTPALRQAIRAVYPARGRPDEAPSASDAALALLRLVPDDSAPDVVSSRFRSDGAHGRLVLLALAALKPLDASGRPIDVAGALNEHGSAAVTTLADTDRTAAGARGFWPVSAAPPSGREDDAILASHAISLRAAAALRSHDVEAFLRDRTLRLTQVVDEFLAGKLEQGLPSRPPTAALFVPED